MFRKLFFMLFTVVFLVGPATLVYAQPEEDVMASTEMLAREAPIAEEDVKIFIRIYKEMSRLEAAEASAYDEGVRAIIEKNNLTEIRAGYLMAKVPFIYAVILGGSKEEIIPDGHDYLKSTPEERAAVKKHLNALTDLFASSAVK